MNSRNRLKEKTNKSINISVYQRINRLIRKGIITYVKYDDGIPIQIQSNIPLDKYYGFTAL